MKQRFEAQTGMAPRSELPHTRMNNGGAGVAVAVLLSVILLLPTGCGKDQETNPLPPSPYLKASDWIASANWSQAQVVQLEMVETSLTQLSFQPNNLTLEAGKPYILRILSRVGNSQKHYFATEGATDFFRAIALRKAQTSQVEYKAPYLKAVELRPEKQVELYLVPVLPGTYDIVCIEPGHKEAGMTAKIVITGGRGYQLDLEVDPAFDPNLASDPRISGSHAVWSTRGQISVQLVELGGGSYAYNPATLNLTKDTAYEITISNPAGNVEKHYYTATEFFRSVVTRKFEDSDAEVKAPYFRAIELLVAGSGTQAKLFVVPAAAGSFYVRCTIAGHTEGGMHGSINVSP